ncbi:MAG: hypothetical protein HY513_02050 [Candidatus Aenigmarchaeota archaeon]|nr:hypothetical protein [Candidatus Aenigmarchaeota archaeon]
MFYAGDTGHREAALQKGFPNGMYVAKAMGRVLRVPLLSASKLACS